MLNQAVIEAFMNKIAEEDGLGKILKPAVIGGALGAAALGVASHGKLNKGLIGALMPNKMKGRIVKDLMIKGGLGGAAIGGASSLISDKL